jgi:hypothetical protein
VWKFVVGFGAAVLLGGIGVQWIFASKPAPTVAQFDWDNAIPKSLERWTVTAEPLGPDLATIHWVAETLNFDAYVCRTYKRKDAEFGIYCAHWNAGKMPAREVEAHSPDICWVLSGERCIESESNVSIPYQGGSLMPGERRVFGSPKGEISFVSFWHLVDRRPYAYVNLSHGLLKTLRALLSDALNGSREQTFVTLSSSVPFFQLESDPGFSRVMVALAALGLGAPVRGALQDSLRHYD